MDDDLNYDDEICQNVEANEEALCISERQEVASTSTCDTSGGGRPISTSSKRKSDQIGVKYQHTKPYQCNGPTTSDDGGLGECCSLLIKGMIWLLVVVFFPFSMCFCLKVVKEYERAVIFRLGRVLPGGAKGPGLFFVMPCADNYRKIDLRTVTYNVPPQEVLSRDSVTVAVDAVVYYRISNPTISVTNVEDVNLSTRLLAQTSLRNVLGTKTLSEMLSDRDAISNIMQSSLDDATERWGVLVERVEMKDVRLPAQMQRAMAAEAEATREAKAKVIAAEGEQKASMALKKAADVLMTSPAALQLRYLQTLNTIATEKNSTIVFPLPIEIMNGLK